MLIQPEIQSSQTKFTPIPPANTHSLTVQPNTLQQDNTKTLIPHPHSSLSTNGGANMNPEKKFRAGTVSATVWMHEATKEGKTFQYPTVSFDKRYKDKEGNWKSTSTLHISEIPKAIMVLGKAYEHLALQGNLQENQPPVQA